MEYSEEAFLAQVNAAREGTILHALNIQLVRAEKDLVMATMPVGPDQRQPAGYLHGGASVVLAETVASFASLLNIDMQHQMAFGLEINANHLRPKRDGVLTAVATPIQRGRTTHIWDIRINDEQDKLICISRCTVAIVERPAEGQAQPERTSS